jgi:hypothetical protein
MHNGTDNAWMLLSGFYPVRVHATLHREPQCTEMHEMKEAERTPTGKSPPRDLPGEGGGCRQLQGVCCHKDDDGGAAERRVSSVDSSGGPKSAAAEIERLPGTCSCPKAKDLPELPVQVGCPRDAKQTVQSPWVRGRV